jgi:Flp pilus assembly CpaE family ATPase
MVFMKKPMMKKRKIQITPVAKNVIKTAEKEGINTTSEYNDTTGESVDIGEEVEDSNNATKEDECKENIDNDVKTECIEGNDSSAESEKSEKK